MIDFPFLRHVQEVVTYNIQWVITRVVPDIRLDGFPVFFISGIQLEKLFKIKDSLNKKIIN